MMRAKMGSVKIGDAYKMRETRKRVNRMRLAEQRRELILVVVDRTVFRFTLCRSVTEIFAVKVESCLKSRRILNVFADPNFVGAPSKRCTHVITAAA